MTILPHSMLVAARPARWWSAFARYSIGVASVMADAAVIIGVSVLIGLAYHLAVYGSIGPLRGFVAVGASAASIFVLPALFRGEYELSYYLSFRSHARRAFAYWNITFVALLALAFVTRALDDYSRASMILFYVMGLPAVVLMRYALVSTVILGSKVGLVTAQRVFLIGPAKTSAPSCGAISRGTSGCIPSARRRSPGPTRTRRRNSAARRSPPICVTRSTPRARCVPTRSTS